MKVKVEREVNLDWLLNQLNDKSQVHPNGMGGYEVRVDKQLLRDAHDVIVQFVSERPYFSFGNGNISITYRE